MNPHLLLWSADMTLWASIESNCHLLPLLDRRFTRRAALAGLEHRRIADPKLS